MVVVAPHSIKSFFIGPVIDGTAMVGENEGRRGPDNTQDPIESTE